MKAYDRGYQLVMGAVMKAMPSARQELIAGPGSISRIPEILEKRGLKKPLLVTGPRVSKTDFFQQILRMLPESAVFSEVEPDPETALVERVIAMYQQERCDCMIAVGGGSNMDAAKAAAAGLARPEKELTQLGGVMKVRRGVPFLLAIPTTAGTGSECTVAAVITDSRTHRKFAINDPVLCPDAAVLDADLTASLPKNVVASTGMDALTHAVEAYLNRRYHKRRTPRQCLEAVHDIMLYLPFVYDDSSNTAARQKLLEASYKAGQAFTVACVGNVHAIAHTLGGLYHIPHGLANAVLLPVVLEDYGEKIVRPLAELAEAGNLAADNKKESALRFIERIRQMNDSMEIPRTLPQIRSEDLDQMAHWAVREANPLYPVPVIYREEDVKRILVQVSELY